MAGGQLVSPEPPKLWSAVHKEGVRTRYRETKKQQPEIHPTRTGLWPPRASREMVREPGSRLTSTSHHPLADPGKICSCSLTMLGAESPRHCPNPLSGGNSWTDQHQGQETPTPTSAPLRAPALFGRPSILPAYPLETPDQAQGIHSLNIPLYFLPPFARGKTHVLRAAFWQHSWGREEGSPGFNLPVNRNQGASKQETGETQLC